MHNEKSTSPETGRVAMEDETLGTNRAATPIPMGAGEQKTAIRWMTPIYGEHTKDVPRAHTDKAK